MGNHHQRTDSNPSAADLAIARQPVFDEHQHLWGYELFCVGQLAASACDVENTAVRVATSAYMGVQQILKQGQKVMMNFDEISILEEMPYALPPLLGAVQVDERLFLRPTIPEALQKLKADGYLIAVNGFSGDQRLEALYRLADIIAVPVIGQTPAQIASLLKSIGDVDARFLARRVDDLAGFDMCREAGVTLFEGAFFKMPDTITVRKMTSNEVSRLKLLQRIEQSDPDVDDIADTIQSDAGISFRLLAYLNSAAFGFSQRIKSIHHAISLLGWARLKNWLRVILLGDMNQSVHATELMKLSAQRARFLELVARSHDFWGFDPESLHLLGLFSLLDVMLATPMEEIVTFLPIDNKLKRALCGDTNNEYQPLIQLARCVEEARWEEAEGMMQRLNLNPGKVDTAFRDAVAWADQLAAAHAEG